MVAPNARKAAHKFVVVKRFKTINTQPARDSITPDEFSWIENLMPIGNSFAPAVPGPQLYVILEGTEPVTTCVCGYGPSYYQVPNYHTQFQNLLLASEDVSPWIQTNVSTAAVDDYSIPTGSTQLAFDVSDTSDTQIGNLAVIIPGVVPFNRICYLTAYFRINSLAGQPRFALEDGGSESIITEFNGTTGAILVESNTAGYEVINRKYESFSSGLTEVEWIRITVAFRTATLNGALFKIFPDVTSAASTKTIRGAGFGVMAPRFDDQDIPDEEVAEFLTNPPYIPGPAKKTYAENLSLRGKIPLEYLDVRQKHASIVGAATFDISPARDLGRTIRVDSNSSVTINLPAATTERVPDGWFCYIDTYQENDGTAIQCTVNSTSNVRLMGDSASGSNIVINADSGVNLAGRGNAQNFLVRYSSQADLYMIMPFQAHGGFLATTATSFIWPYGIKSIAVTGSAPGGGGGDGSATAGGGGGGSGQAVQYQIINNGVPGTNYTISIGTPGIAGTVTATNLRLGTLLTLTAGISGAAGGAAGGDGGNSGGAGGQVGAMGITLTGGAGGGNIAGGVGGVSQASGAAGVAGLRGGGGGGGPANQAGGAGGPGFLFLQW